MARELALQILYRYEEGDHNLKQIIDQVLESGRYRDEDRNFSQILVTRTIDALPQIDKHISKVLEHWDFNRVSLIDKIILRLGTCEILYFDDIPPRVSINEAIELGKKFGGSDSGRFINGVLDAVRKNYEGGNHK